MILAIEKVDCLASAVRLVASHWDIDDRAVVEQYPYPLTRSPRGVFAYQFFNKAGLNIGYYLPDMTTVAIFEYGREYPEWQHKLFKNVGKLLITSGGAEGTLKEAEGGNPPHA